MLDCEVGAGNSEISWVQIVEYQERFVYVGNKKARIFLSIKS